MKKSHLITFIVVATTLLLCSCNKGPNLYYKMIYTTDKGTSVNMEGVGMEDGGVGLQSFVTYGENSNSYRINGHYRDAASIEFSGAPDQTHFEYRNNGEQKGVSVFSIPQSISSASTTELISAKVDLLSIDEEMIEGIFSAQIYRDHLVSVDANVIKIDDTLNVTNGYFKVPIVETYQK